MQVTRVKSALDEHAERQGVTRTAVAYAWLMAHPSRPIPIVGTQTPSRIAESAGAFQVRFSRADWDAILVARRGGDRP